MGCGGQARTRGVGVVHEVKWGGGVLSPLEELAHVDAPVALLVDPVALVGRSHHLTHLCAGRATGEATGAHLHTTCRRKGLKRDLCRRPALWSGCTPGRAASPRAPPCPPSRYRPGPPRRTWPWREPGRYLTGHTSWRAAPAPRAAPSLPGGGAAGGRVVRLRGRMVDGRKGTCAMRAFNSTCACSRAAFFFARVSLD